MTKAQDNQERVNIPDDASMDLATQSDVSIMEMMATADEVRALTEAVDQPFYLFGEDRANGIHWFNAIPRHWVTDRERHLSVFHGVANPGEFYVFQIGVYAPDQGIGELSFESSDLAADVGGIPADAIACLSLGGIDFMGKSFRKTLVVNTGCVQALWIGIAVPAEARGTYTGTITVTAAGSGSQQLELTLDVSGEPVADHGDTDAWRLSRLRWLNSALGLDDDQVPAPYQALQRDGQVISLLGKRLTLGANGLPEQFESFFNPGNTAIAESAKPLLAAPLRFVVETDTGDVELTTDKLVFLREQAGAIEWEATAGSPALTVVCRGLMEFDGFIECKCTVEAHADLAIQDIRVETELHDDGRLYFTGLGLTGRSLPDEVDWTWKPRLRHDCFWLGSVNAGMRFELRGRNYRTPLVNAYYRFGRLKMPESWCNDGRGGITIRRHEGRAHVSLYSGARELAAGEDLLFQLNLNLTPFKPLDTDTQWRDRYLHPNYTAKRWVGADVDELLADMPQVRALGANIFNLHHNNTPTPAINYPYWDKSFPYLKQAVNDAHAHDIRFKVYYTSREITNLLPELWAFYSMNGEIIYPGPGADTRVVTNPGGPHLWLCEHMREHFIPAWRETLKAPYDGLLDLSVITTPDSRLDNFYIEGLQYLLDHVDIDGVYVDDTSLGRKTFQRAKRLILKHNPQGLIDLHSWNGVWQECYGNFAPLLTYMPNLPYIDRLWLGEAFRYDVIDPEMWLIDMSGIPLGLMGEMLHHNNGNPWRGMVFGQTIRLGWGGDPRPIWKLWDDFGMEGCEMLGWWDPRCPVACSDPGVHATVYRKPGKALISLGSWAEAEVAVRLQIDWDALGLNPRNVTLTQPDVEGVQDAATYAVDDPIPLAPTRGALLVVESDDWKIPVSKADFHVFLLMGQSNMAGYGELLPEDKQPLPRVVKLPTKGELKWEPASHPLHNRQGTDRFGLSLPFAEEYLKDKPGVVVGLIPVAWGGAEIDRLKKGTSTYTDAMKKADIAMTQGVIKGILWHQGESDAVTPELSDVYEAKLHQLIQDIRDDLRNTKLPFIVGNLAEFYGTGKDHSHPDRVKRINQVRQVLRELPEKVPYTGFVESTGCSSADSDMVHFDRKSYIMLGKRYAKVYDKKDDHE